MTCEGNYETCPCDDCEAVRVSPRPSVDEDGIWLPRPIGRSVGIASSNDREQLIADGFVSLVDIVGVIRRNGGFLRPEDQALLRQAEAVIAQAKVTP